MRQRQVRGSCLYDIAQGSRGQRGDDCLHVGERCIEYGIDTGHICRNLLRSCVCGVHLFRYPIRRETGTGTVLPNPPKTKSTLSRRLVLPCSPGRILPRLSARRRSPRSGHRLAASSADSTSLRRSNPTRRVCRHSSPGSTRKAASRRLIVRVLALLNQFRTLDWAEEYKYPTVILSQMKELLAEQQEG